MADTKRTRAAILALFADNVTGDISAQDDRDRLVTNMPLESFINEDDFWAQPQFGRVGGDRTGKGWVLYSQVVDSLVSFGDVLYMVSTGNWRTADAAQPLEKDFVGMVLESYAAAASQCLILRKGLILLSAWSGIFSDNVGKKVYLDSGTSGAFSMVQPTSALVLGVALPTSMGSINSINMFFDPQWAVVS